MCQSAEIAADTRKRLIPHRHKLAPSQLLHSQISHADTALHLELNLEGIVACIPACNQPSTSQCDCFIDMVHDSACLSKSIGLL